MPIQVLMPALSPTMTEGKLAKWLKSEGDEVNFDVPGGEREFEVIEVRTEFSPHEEEGDYGCMNNRMVAVGIKR